MNQLLLLMHPFAGALTGWVVAVLFFQRFAGPGLKGMRKDLAAGAGNVAGRLVRADELSAKLRNPALLDELKPSIEAHVDAFLQVKLKEKVPVLSVFIGGSTLDKIRAGLLEEIDLLLPEVIGQYADKLGAGLDAGALVGDRLHAMPDAEFDALARPLLLAARRRVQVLGAVVGLTTGLVLLGLGLLVRS